MTGSPRSFPGSWKGYIRPWAAIVCGCAVAGSQVAPRGPAAWTQALAAREAFEAEPVGQHTRAEYAEVMDGFRAIYHGNPGDLYAPRAADAVAGLLAEQGRELKDRKSLRDAAGQYEFLAKAYPASSLAAPALGKALELLGPDAADDKAEADKVNALLQANCPHSRASKSAGDTGIVAGPPAADGEPAGVKQSTSPAGMTDRKAAAVTGAAGPVEGGFPSAGEPAYNQRHVSGAAPAMVTGIRHWSTATYTRVAVDLGGEVEFQAARVEHPDRIFFDLHGAKLAPGLAGKNFTITDDGFLKSIRAGQFGADVTRIVLDVQPVAQYSAFLLPNPTRLIIDIHGKPANEAAKAAGAAPIPAKEEPTATAQASVAPVERVQPKNQPGAVTNDKSTNPQLSSLPPMPVTDGSASFGLPPKRDQAITSTSEPVARPRVVVSARPTTVKPVPNSVSSAVPAGNREVAAVSEGPGVIAATEKPTSRPVVDRVVGSRHKAQPAKPSEDVPEEAGVPAAPPPPTADGQSTLMRALGLKIGRIVIDAGHGGHDSGTLGPEGIEEKDVVLDVTLRLGKLLHDRLGAEIVYTRADDTFIPLETRTAIANKAQADLFISVHANSSSDPSARGVEVYYLNFTSDPEAMQVAGRENAVSSQRVNQLSDLVKKIALKDKIDESRELAADVDTSLYAGLKRGNEGLKDRGVKKAPFVVLIGANMPSILAEISFVTNPDDADELRRPEYRERVAESLYGGVARYAGAINHGAPAKSRMRSTERAER